MHGPREVHYHIDLLNHANPETPAWTEHPMLGARADIVALPVKEMTNIVGEINSVSLGNDWHRWDIGSELHVIGYPYGQIGGPFPIWSKGSIASEPDVDIAGLPVFLIDCRSRPGQSGSPVFAHFRAGAVVEHEGRTFQAKKPMNYFVGVYSGRLRSDSDLGLVWKRNCIEELVNHAITHGTQHKMGLRRHQFSATFSEEFSLDRYVPQRRRRRRSRVSVGGYAYLVVLKKSGPTHHLAVTAGVRARLEDRFGVTRDAQTVKPQAFRTGDGWFAYNLAANLAQIQG